MLKKFNRLIVLLAAFLNVIQIMKHLEETLDRTLYSTSFSFPFPKFLI